MRRCAICALLLLCAHTARAQTAGAAASAAASVLLRGVSALLGDVVTPALHFAARGSRGVNERLTYAKYATLGPYAVGWRSMPAVPKTDGDWSWEVVSALVARAPFQTTFPAMLYYPAMFSGRNTPPAQEATPFPIVGFAVGWTCDVAMYTKLLERLASHGIVVVAPMFNDLATDPLTQVNFRSQLSQILSAVAYVGAQSSAKAAAFGDLTTSTTWHNRVDTARLGLFGHSAGAGVVLQGAAEQGARVKAVVTLGAWANVATTPWMASLPSAVTAPVMLLSGQNDTLAPLAANGQRVFDALTSPKIMPVLAGGSHWCVHTLSHAHRHVSSCIICGLTSLFCFRCCGGPFSASWTGPREARLRLQRGCSPGMATACALQRRLRRCRRPSEKARA
jgi:dienelactone hydrolase